MSPDVIEMAGRRIAQHAEDRQLSHVRVILHGGEPLLIGTARMSAALAVLGGVIRPIARLSLAIQTNGVRLDAAMADVFKAHGVQVGVSLDGDQQANDRHRRYSSGASSFAAVRHALALLRRPEYREIYGGILCTVDLRNPPLEVYRALAAEKPANIDFLLPHATWEQPPARPDGEPTPYAAWLAAIYDQWRSDGEPMRIRIFDALHATAAGDPSGSEQIGAEAADLLVIDTDGQYEQADSIKVAYDGAPDTGLNVFDHTIDDVSRLEPVAVRQGGIAQLSAVCQSCPVVQRCRGGLYAHRFRASNGFDNPSAYCADLRALIETVDHKDAAWSVIWRDQLAQPVDLVEQIAAGFGDEPTMRWLAEGQLNVTRGALRLVAETGTEPAAWRALTELERSAPDAVRAVLTHPYLRVWATEVLGGRAAAPGYLATAAAAAAVHAGEDLDLAVVMRGGAVHLPTVGTFYHSSVDDAKVRIAVRDGAVTIGYADGERTVAPGDPADFGWQPVRTVRLGSWALTVEDADPHRDCHGWPAQSRLAPDAEAAWREAITQAWDVIQTDGPGYAPALQVGLRTLVPLVATADGRKRAATAHQAFGSLGSTLAAPADLAVMLVHEFQHGKLGALLDMYDLVDRDRDATVMVGWKDEPRPIEAALQGAYAHAAVANMWRARSAYDPDGAPVYRQYRDWTADALGKLRDSDALTKLGWTFVERMAWSMASWPE